MGTAVPFRPETGRSGRRGGRGGGQGPRFAEEGPWVRRRQGSGTASRERRLFAPLSFWFSRAATEEARFLGAVGTRSVAWRRARWACGQEVGLCTCQGRSGGSSSLVPGAGGGWGGGEASGPGAASCAPRRNAARPLVPEVPRRKLRTEGAGGSLAAAGDGPRQAAGPSGGVGGKCRAGGRSSCSEMGR